ncbi:hypothetical protein [Limnovirga soli]|nr:hypothetical protein [Limnovirga soli]
MERLFSLFNFELGAIQKHVKFLRKETIMKLSINKKSYWATYGLTIVSVVCFISLPAIFNKPKLDDTYKLLVDEINKSCPKTVDSVTRLENSVVLPANKIQFNYSFINADKVNVDTTLSKDNMKPSLINYVKTSSTCKIYRDNNTTLFFNYQDRNGDYLFRIIVTPELYN